jgi:hypothetical protein
MSMHIKSLIKNQTMLISTNNNFQTMLIPNNIDDIIDGGAPDKDGGGGRETLSITLIPISDMYGMFDASTIQTSDYDATTKDISIITDQVTNTPFQMNHPNRDASLGSARYYDSGVYVRYGNFQITLSDHIYNLQPGSFTISAISVHKYKRYNNDSQQNWGAYMHLSQKNGYFANVFGLAKRGSSMYYLIRANHSTLNGSSTFADVPIILDRKDICYAEVIYDDNTKNFTRNLKIYSGDDGTPISSTTQSDTVDRKITNIQNTWVVGGYSDYNQFSTYLIYQSILHKRALTDTELADSVSYLTNKWKDV